MFALLEGVRRRTCPGPWWSPHLIDISRKQHLLAAQTHSCVKPRPIAARRRVSLFSFAAISFDMWTCQFSPGFSSPSTLRCRLCLSVLVLQVGPKKKRRREGRESTKDAQSCDYFLFSKEKKSQGFFILLYTAFMKTDKGQICYFPSEKVKGLLYFPADSQNESS